MHTLTVPILPEGPLLEVLLGLGVAQVQTLRTAGQPIREAVPARALVDTGAEITCVDRQILASLVAVGLVPKDFVIANLPALGGVIPAAEFDIGLTIVFPRQQSYAGEPAAPGRMILAGAAGS